MEAWSEGNTETLTLINEEMLSTTPTLPGNQSSETKTCELYNLLVRVVISGCLVIFGLIGNGLTIVVMASDRQRSATILLLCYLAVLDCLVLLEYGFMAIPFSVLRTLDMYPESSRLQILIIAYVAPVGQTTNLVSVCVTVLVTWQRYVSVCRPHSARSHLSVYKTNVLVTCSIIFSVLFHLPMYFNYRVLDNYPSPGKTTIVTTEFGLQKSYQIFYSIVLFYMVSYILPMIALIYMTTSLIRALRMARIKRSSTTSSSSGKAREELTLSLVIVVIIFIICQSIGPFRRILMWVYDPYRAAVQCGAPLFFFGPWVITSLLVNSAVNFVIYVLFAKGFRKKLMGFFRRSKVAPGMIETMTNDSVHQLDSFTTA